MSRMAKIYGFISKEVVSEQYKVMNGVPVSFVQEGCDMTKFI